VSGTDQPAAGAHFQLVRRSSGAQVSWRLLGGNHRGIGCSAVGYPAVAECLAAVKEVIERIEELECVVSRAPLNRWEWRLRQRGGIDLVMAAHTYDRRIRAVHAHLQFRSLAVTARIDDIVVDTASRRWGPREAPAARGTLR
jgi:hypothetical protein